MSGEGVCEVCDNRNKAGITVCEWCETALPRPRPVYSGPSAGLSKRPSPRRPKRTPRPLYRLLVGALGIGIPVSALFAFGLTPQTLLNMVSGSHPSTAEPAPGIDFFNLAVGQCINQYDYASKLNAPTLTNVACDSSAARVKFVRLEEGGKQKDDCARGGLDWRTYDSKVYCFQFLIHPNVCYSAWISPGGSGKFYLSLPHACDEVLPADLQASKPAGTWDLKEVRVTDVSAGASGSSCKGYSFAYADLNVDACLSVV